MNFIDLNTHGAIGASATFLQIGSFNILIDSGLHPKKEGKDALPNFDTIKGQSIDLILLTHCHLDHIGSLPIIAWHHPEAPILMIPNLTSLRECRNSINVMKHAEELELGTTALQHRILITLKNN